MHFEENSRFHTSPRAEAPQVHPSEKRMHIEENPGSSLRPEQQLLRYTHQRKDAHRGKSRVHLSARTAAPQEGTSREKGCI
jgi:hypothetical protein